MHVITGDQTVYTKGLYYKASADITALEACAILQIANYTLNSQTPPPSLVSLSTYQPVTFPASDVWSIAHLLMSPSE